MSIDGLVPDPRAWSKFGTHFGGVSVDVLLDAGSPLSEATHVLGTSTTGYTTNGYHDLGDPWLEQRHQGD